MDSASTYSTYLDKAYEEFFEMFKSLHQLSKPAEPLPLNTHLDSLFLQKPCSSQEAHICWSSAEDKILMQVTTKYKNDWKKIRRRLETVMRKSFSVEFLRDRFKKIKVHQTHTKFSSNEDRKLIGLATKYNLAWSKIAEMFENRDPINLKNRYYYLKRKSTKKININSR